MNITRLMLAHKFFLLVIFFSFSGCSGGGGGDGVSQGTRVQSTTVSGCFLEDYSDPATSEYILPYQVGMTFSVGQGNCGQFTHQPVCDAGGFPCGDLRYGYDFLMPIGLVVLAARGGSVVLLDDQFSNATTMAGEENIVIIEHSDGTFGRYFHLDGPNSLMVNFGDVITQGAPIGMSGDSGFTGSTPTFSFAHLHFDVIQEDSSTCTMRQTSVDANGGNIIASSCKTLPVTFRNAQPLDAPLIVNRMYTALPF